MILFLRVALGAVFAVSAVAKLRDRTGTERAVADFGVPPFARAVVAQALPVAELAVAVALIVPATSRLGGGAALVLLAAFTAAMLRLVRRGEAPDCHCFGQLSAAPVGWSSVVRNLVLAAAAVAVAASDAPASSVVDWADGFADGTVSSSLVLAAVVGFGVALVLGQRRIEAQQRAMSEQIGLLRLAVEYRTEPASASARPERATPDIHPGLPIGAPAPTFTLTDRTGSAVTLDEFLAAGRPVVLVFTSPSCVPCATLLPQIAEWEGVHGERLTIVIVSRGDAAEAAGKAAAYTGRHFVFDPDGLVARRYRSDWTPGAVVVGADGRMAGGISYGPDAVADLVLEALRPNVYDEPLPDAELSRGGEVFDSVALLGTEHLLVFWSETCPHCRSMEHDLSRFAASMPTPIVITDGGADGVAERLGVASYDDVDRRFMTAVGVTATPSAVLVGADGRVRTPLAVGADSVLALAGVLERSVGPVSVELRR